MLQQFESVNYCWDEGSLPCQAADSSASCQWPTRPESPATLILRELEQERERKRRLEWYLEEVMLEKKLLTEESMARSSYFAMVGFPDDSSSFAQASSFSYLPRGRSSAPSSSHNAPRQTSSINTLRGSNKRARREPQPEFGSWSGSSSSPSSPATFAAPNSSYITQTVEELSTTLSWTQSCINSSTYTTCSSSPVEYGSAVSSPPGSSYSFLGSLNSNTIEGGSWESPVITSSEGEGDGDIKELQKLLETSEEDVDFFSCFRTINEGRQWLATTNASRPTC